MKEIIAYEMLFKGNIPYSGGLSCISFREKHWTEYMKIYNECFYEMRKVLEIEPINFYSDYSQMKDKADNTYLYLQNGMIAALFPVTEMNWTTCSLTKRFKGAVWVKSCYCGE